MQSIVSFVHVQLRWLPVRRLPEWLVCMTPVFLQIEECHNCKSEKCQKVHSSYLSHGRTWKKPWCSDVMGKTWCFIQWSETRDVVRIWRLILRVRQGRNGRTMSYCLARFSRQVQKEKEKERKFKESCVWQRSPFPSFSMRRDRSPRRRFAIWCTCGSTPVVASLGSWISWILERRNVETSLDLTQVGLQVCASWKAMSEVSDLFFFSASTFVVKVGKSNVQYIIDYNSIYVIYVYIIYAAANLE